MTSYLANLLYDLPDPDPENQASAPVPPPEVQALARIGVAVFNWFRSASGIEEKLAASDPDAASRLRVAMEEIRDSLSDAEMQIEDPLGRSLPEVIDVASIRGWRYQKGVSPETVCQVIAPVIRYRGSLVRRGQVIMASAPPEELPPGPEEAQQK